MKRIFTILISVLFTAIVFAQAPQKMSYQAVVRDASDNLVTNQTVGMQLSILKGSAGGTLVYSEIQTPTTNDNGLLSIEFGGGIGFDTINWASDSYFIKTETDLTGGTTYSITGTSQLLSVPYALYAKNTDGWSVESDTIFTEKLVGIGTSSPNSALDISNGYLSISGGSFGHSNSIVSNKAPFASLKFYCGPNTGNASNGFFFRASDTIGQVNNFSSLMRIAPHDVDVVRVGIGTSSPARNLHINSVMRLEPRATAPSNPSEGDIYMDSIIHKLMVFDGTIWQACW